MNIRTITKIDFERKLLIVRHQKSLNTVAVIKLQGPLAAIKDAVYDPAMQQREVIWQAQPVSVSLAIEIKLLEA